MQIANFYFIFLLCLSGRVTIIPSSILTVDEGKKVYFSCTGTGPHLLQVNNNVTTDRFILEDADGNGAIKERTVEYYLSNTLREDNGTTLQCFFNGEGSRILTLVVNRK